MFKNDFPFSAPRVKFITQIYHPQVDKNGKIKVQLQKVWVPTC